jgi:hypothetical protein
MVGTGNRALANNLCIYGGVGGRLIYSQKREGGEENFFFIISHDRLMHLYLFSPLGASLPSYYRHRKENQVSTVRVYGHEITMYKGIHI